MTKLSNGFTTQILRLGVAVFLDPLLLYIIIIVAVFSTVLFYFISSCDTPLPNDICLLPLNATRPTIIPQAKNTRLTRNQMTPHVRLDNPYNSANLDASDSNALRNTKSSKISHKQYKHDMTPRNRTKYFNPTP